MLQNKLDREQKKRSGSGKCLKNFSLFLNKSRKLNRDLFTEISFITELYYLYKKHGILIIKSDWVSHSDYYIVKLT